MASRFDFDLRNGSNTLQDDEGVEASSLDEAAEHAQAALEDMGGTGEAPATGDGWRLVISDESGMTLRSISLDNGALH